MPRPKKATSEKKTYMLRVRLSQGEQGLLERAAKVKSLQLSSWVRSEMLSLARKIVAEK